VDHQKSLARLEEHEAQIDFIYRRLQADLEPVRIARDAIPELERGLAKIRASKAYSVAFAEAEPVVSVRIASYENPDALVNIAIASVLAQTYQRFEIVVVNDGPSPATRAAVEALNDDRIRYEEFPHRNSYPEDARSRWMVAGSPGMNRGATLARGTWIAPLDQDDSFTPDHIEKLLAAARESSSELVYGAITQKNLVDGSEKRVWSSPPQAGAFSFQGVLHLRLLSDIFHYDEASWLVDEPGDWNLMRRMLAAGVKIMAIDDVVAVMNTTPYAHKPSE
jgi:glycosyltransferase involved in cell wall biosynthesis